MDIYEGDVVIDSFLETIDLDDSIPIVLDIEEINASDLCDFNLIEDDLFDVLDMESIQLPNIPTTLHINEQDKYEVTETIPTFKRKKIPPVRQSPRKKVSTKCDMCGKVFKRVQVYQKHVSVCSLKTIRQKGKPISFLRGILTVIS